MVEQHASEAQTILTPTARLARAEFENGIAWGEAKRQLFELVNGELAEARDNYRRLMEEPAHIEDALQQGAARARKLSEPLIRQARDAVGISTIR